MGERQKGFTLIELVTIIVLVTILSVAALSRFLGADQFATYTARDQLLSELHYLQQLNLAGQNCQLNVNGNGFWLTATCGSPSKRARQERCDSGAVINNGVCLNDGVALTMAGTNVFSLSFDDLGRVNNCTLTAGQCRLTISGSDTLSLCIENQGYIHDCP
ncbi:type II secretion system protein [Ferrimonas kyonanensis]|uniref:type II secretion system protein n=1 Tax=Ferrimonas kyonanensis TaxID=364763 RepID=UPI00041832A9|nr:type II secretion system protein [Ferrimonas kyonanensis]